MHAARSLLRTRRWIDDIPSLYDRLRSAVGKAHGLPEDAAHDHDHYLYGLPRK